MTILPNYPEFGGNLTTKGAKIMIKLSFKIIKVCKSIKIKDFLNCCVLLFLSLLTFKNVLKSFVTLWFKKSLLKLQYCHFERNEVESKNLKPKRFKGFFIA